MTYEESLEIYKAQTINVKALWEVKTQINRVINQAIRKKDFHLVESQSKILALIFSIWSEAYFSKTIHTPHGLDLADIEKVKNSNKENVQKGWYKLLEISTAKATRDPKSKKNSIANIKLKLQRYLEEYIIEPSILRNKIAHGQIKFALNRENTKINIELTNKLNDLDAVTIGRYFEIYKYILEIIEYLIETPDKKFYDKYYPSIEELEDYIKKTSGYSIQQKIEILKRKNIKRD